tara:strand:+ start:144 stop:851 length:708 start_codon:yes stop_codon:yes gene_type:complete
MKYKIILILFLTSCSNYTYNNKSSFSYYGKGFAYIEKIQTFDKKDDVYISHNLLKIGTKMRITNPNNKKFIELIVKKKKKYDNFYKILISEQIAKKLELDLNFPYVEVNEIKQNKSFIAKKAVMENIEKKIANKAPISKINISNLSKKKNFKYSKKKNYSIIVAEFYSLESAKALQERLMLILEDSNYQLIYINKKNAKSYELLMGPYNTINKLKNDYIVLSDSNFEDLDIIINE